MRLWHKSLIPYLPRQQLLGQWRECCCIAKNIATTEKPNHILVNKIMDFPLSHFYNYGVLIAKEMDKREYKCEFEKFSHWFTYPHETKTIKYDDVFKTWHNDRYLTQCIFNLEEKHDCQGITDDEWNVLLNGYKEITRRDWEK